MGGGSGGGGFEGRYGIAPDEKRGKKGEGERVREPTHGKYR